MSREWCARMRFAPPIALRPISIALMKRRLARVRCLEIQLGGSAENVRQAVVEGHDSDQSYGQTAEHQTVSRLPLANFYSKIDQRV